MEFIDDPFGLHTRDLIIWQMLLRALIVFVAAFILIRIAGIRTLGKQTAFDQLTVLILGSILGRAVVTGKSFFGQLAAVLLIMIFHRTVAWVTFRNHKLGEVLKGKPLLLFSDGQKEESNMSKENITEDDITEAMHLSINADSKETVKKIYLERSGEISFVKTKL